MLQQAPTAFGSDYETASKLTEEHFAERVRDDDENFISGAFIDSILVGTCGGRRDQDLKRRHIGYVWGMYLQPAQRGSGLAARLLTSTLSRLQTLAGLEVIQLAVTRDNLAAEALYRQAGFIEYGIEPAALKVDGQNYDERLMWLPLNADQQQS